MATEEGAAHKLDIRGARDVNARIFLAHGVVAAALTIGVIHSAGLTATTASAGEVTGRVILADDKWDVVLPIGGGAVGTGTGNS